MNSTSKNYKSSSFSASAHSNRSGGGRGRGLDMKDHTERSRGRGSGGGGGDEDTIDPNSSSFLSTFGALDLMDSTSKNYKSSSFSASAHSDRSGGGGRGREVDMKDNAESSRGHGSGGRGGGKDRIDANSSSFLSTFRALDLKQSTSKNYKSSSFSACASAHSNRSGSGRGRGRGLDMKDNAERSRGRGSGGGGGGKDRIDALGRLLTRILRHMASELNLDMRSDGFVKVKDLLKLNIKTFANVPLRSHTVEDIMEAVRKDNKQRFSLVEENGELLIRANQGHTVMTVETESLLKPILSAEEFPVCVHGTYKRNLKSILESGLKRMQRLHVHFSSGLPTDGEVISGMRRDVNILIFLDVRKALEEGMKLYISDNKVILTEGFDGVVPVKYFEKIESWPDRQLIPGQID